MLVSPRHPQAEAWAVEEATRLALEQMRSGGWERSARDAEAIPLIDTGARLAAPGGSRLPVAISPIVDARFGTTIALGVPADDKTDEVLARRLGLEAEAEAEAGADGALAALGPAVRYKASDWVISRQRSWGTPIPIVYCERCGTVPVAKDELPVVLPLQVRPTGTGNPLAELDSFVHVSCPGCGGAARRETDTLDCHFDALWLWIPACVPPQSRDEDARGDPRAARPASLAALRAARRGLGQRQLRVRPAHRDKGAARHRPARVPRRRRAVRGLPVPRDGHTRAPQDEQASRQRGRPRRARRDLRRRHGAPRGALRGAPAEVAELERLGGAALPPLPDAPLGLLAGAHRPGPTPSRSATPASTCGSNSPSGARRRSSAPRRTCRSSRCTARCAT